MARPKPLTKRQVAFWTVGSHSAERLSVQPPRVADSDHFALSGELRFEQSGVRVSGALPPFPIPTELAISSSFFRIVQFEHMELAGEPLEFRDEQERWRSRRRRTGSEPSPVSMCWSASQRAASVTLPARVWPDVA